IEMIRELMDKEEIDFDEALERVKSKIVFTTHTPVVAGNEVHEHELLKYMGAYDGLTYGQMLKIGGNPFSMTAAGLRLSRKANAVAKLHGETAREMWKDIPGGSDIIAVTNGVHNKTWQDSGVYNAFKAKNGLWDEHMRCKRAMIDEIEKRNGVRLREDVLTIGFARRAAPYKRSDLIFRDKKVIDSLLKNKKLQIVFSGKAHPNDLTGKGIISNLYKISQEYPESVVFIQNYDIAVGKMLTRGCDVWLNNPIRPMEASGTSGMKAAMNGVLNLSVLDGWWPEGCEHGVNGWSIGGGYQGDNSDDNDSKSLYKVLKEEVIPTYYDNNGKWVDMMGKSIEMSTWNFSAARMVREYYEKMYEV
ncbi:MAG TPA: alpha-glucan family phosphorylase, partial [Ruminiclostridium sp.]|nr:alpha-glucan family phosphorylase [Ruminiclostridium sp.]